MGRTLRADFRNAAQVHHRDAVGDVSDDREIVGDEQIGKAMSTLQVLHQVDDLGLHGHIERRDRFVGDDKSRVDGNSASDPDTLTLSA